MFIDGGDSGPGKCLNIAGYHLYGERVVWNLFGDHFRWTSDCSGSRQLGHCLFRSKCAILCIFSHNRDPPESSALRSLR
jgi:hypothetical protein